MKRQGTDWEKNICLPDIKGLVSRLHIELLQFNNNKESKPMNMGQRSK